MKIRIKECVVNSRIYREDGTLAGSIEGWPKNGPIRKLCRAEGDIICQVKKEKGGCAVEYEAAGSSGRSAIRFQYEDTPGEDGGRGPSALLRAPLAVKACVRLESGILTIRQTRKREFSLEDESGTIGRITKMASLNSHEVECSKEIGVFEAAVIYVVAGYMYHDDDVEVV